MQYRVLRLTAWLLLLTLAVGLCSGCAVRNSPYGQGFRLPLGTEPLQLDPQVATDTASLTVLRSLMVGLTVYEAGEVKPALAERWVVSEDGTVITFTLREAKWQSGAAVTAEDFVFAWRRIADPATRSPHAALLSNVRGAAAIAAGNAPTDTLGVTATDARTLRVELVQADAQFLKQTASTAFFPCNAAFFEGTGGRYGLETEHVAACGAFELTAWEHGEYLVLEKNDAYFRAADILPSRIRYLIEAYENPVSALQSGALDVSPLTPEQADAARSEGLTVEHTEDSLLALWFNTAEPSLRDAAVRRALRAGLETEVIRSELTAQGLTPADGFVPPDATVEGEFYRTGQNACRFETGNAAALLTQARGDAGPMPTLTLLCADDANSIRLAQYVVQSWQKNLELYFSLSPLPQEELAARVAVGNYQLALYTHIGTSVDAADLLAAFCSDAQRGNLAGLADAAYDALLRDGDGKRAALEASEQMLGALCPCVPLAFPKRCFGFSEGVVGLRVLPFADGTYFPIYDPTQATRDE